MEKRVIKTLIIEKQNEIPGVKLVERPLELEATGNYVFTGIRRAGKSYLLYQHIQHLIKTGIITAEDVLYVNFEDERISSIRVDELDLFLVCYKELYNTRPIIFLDEIQNITGWEKFARRLADSKYQVFITGSNAKMLSKEIYTTLGGRFIAREVYPFLFQEYLNYHEVVPGTNWEFGNDRLDIFRMFADYFYYGGFAESFPMKDKRSWLNALYQKILLGDVISRNDIRNENAIRVLVKKLAESVMQPLSLSRIKNVVDSTGASVARNTLVDYLQILTDAFLIFSVSNFTDKLSEKESFRKRYFFDNGLLNCFLFDPEAKLLENLVALVLKQKYGDDFFYYNRNVEVDFFLPKIRKAIQVSYSISNELTKIREVKALIKLSTIFPVDKLEIVTFDEEATLLENGLTIDVVPVWKWLLQ